MIVAQTARTGRKFEQVVEGARAVFMRDGFEGASVDEIARVSRVSKATLYSYFADKRAMFFEVARAECHRQADECVKMIGTARSAPEALRSAGHDLLRFLTSEFGLSVFRICVAESDRFPELGQQFYRSGPAMVRDRLIGYFESAMARGELVIDDVELAADQFAELCKADIFPRILFCGACRPGEAEIGRVVDGAVETFMARYGASRA
ncbi:TetR/AcrR family transcriptional regulator [Roseitranquillus sediminis]|uniref:TetR/AcrR family transcriptional regulator n=1 Tax=Roseitranquillus sediminis TaxID=2809051 RepID=UPI001D0C58E6|nr:TetR/AcrR family transcriptional regulator [Roseitranquillus sediminis]MBM9593221.1 TetR/AcrR family transcriptional regulator [Roseitranquillus sediminis]